MENVSEEGSKTVVPAADSARQPLPPLPQPIQVRALPGHW
jgi:hypothetical protein